MNNREKLKNYQDMWNKALENGFDPTKSILQENSKKESLSENNVLKNPVQPNTLGPDSALTDKAIDATYTPEDIQKLEELKIQLHALGDKIAEMKDDPKSMKKLAKLQEKIEALSNEMSDPTKNAQQKKT